MLACHLQHHYARVLLRENKDKNNDGWLNTPPLFLQLGLVHCGVKGVYICKLIAHAFAATRRKHIAKKLA